MAGDKNEPVRLVPTLTDAEKATDYKRRMGDLLVPIVELMTEAKKDSMALNFTLQYDGMGRAFIQILTVVKEL